MLDFFFVYLIFFGFGVFVIFIVGVVFYDIIQMKYVILYNFLVVGYFCYWFEKIGFEMCQYWVVNDKEEVLFNCQECFWVYVFLKGQNNNQGFGMFELFYLIGYLIIKQKVFFFLSYEVCYIDDDFIVVLCFKVFGEEYG